jgi:hypothetical protein
VRTPHDTEPIAQAVTLLICIGKVCLFSLYQVLNILPVNRYAWRGAEEYENALQMTQNTSTTGRTGLGVHHKQTQLMSNSFAR